MNVNPSAAAASVAGTARASAKGGETDNQASLAKQRQSAAAQPGGKAEGTSELSAGDQAGDRGPDGRQVLDVFERSKEEKSEEEETKDLDPPRQPEGHLDLEA